MTEKMISVIIPTYNAASFVKNAFDSIEKQSYNNVEVIAVDDCSQDNTYALLLSIQKEKRYRFPLKVYKMDKNSGQGNARNKGIRYADGEYIMFLDSDDLLETNALARMVSEISEDVDICMCSFYRMRMGLKQSGLFSSREGYYNTKELLSNIYTTWPLNWFSCVGTKLYRTDVINSYDIRFNETDYRYNEDLGFIVDYMRVCHKIKVIKDELYCYTYTPGSVQHKNKYKDNSLVTIRNARMNFRKLLEENELLDSMEASFLRSQVGMYSTILMTDWESYEQFKDVYELMCSFPELQNILNIHTKNLMERILVKLIRGRDTRTAYRYFKIINKGRKIAVFVRNKVKV